VQQLSGQSRYRVDVHECSDFLDVLRYNAVESLSQPWRYDVAVTCSSADIACESLLLKPASFTFQTPMFDGTPALPVGRYSAWWRHFAGYQRLMTIPITR
jgi:type VI secretion system secreted protein VgrG